MEQIKDKYLNPVPVLYTYKGMPENTLISNDFDTAKNITLTKNDNEVSQLTFSIPFTVDRKVSYDDCEKLVLFENEYYIIKDIQVEDNATGSIKVTCKHKSVELKGIYCEPINLIGVSPNDMFDKIMTSTKHPYNTGYKFKGTDVPSDKKRHLITENEASVYENLVSMAKVFNGWLEFSTDDSGQNWIFLRTKTIKNNKYVKKGLDMKALNISYNSDELFTRVQPFGAKDKYGIEVNIMGVNPTKQSYVANYSWYLAKGIPMEVIKREAQYQQFKQMHMDEYTDAKDLYEFALEELEKCCVPKLEATLDMQDLSIYVDSLDDPPEIGYEITCINPDIDFILSCQITGVERNYDNPMATKVTIANFIRYDTVFQNINHGAEAGDRVTSGDSSDGTYVPEQNVNDGHINLTRKLGDFSTKIIENEKEIILTAKKANENEAKILVQADRIENTVKRVGVAESHIEQQADEISLRVKTSEFGSEIRQHDRDIRVAWNKISNYAQIDDTDGLILGNESDGTYSKVGYDGRLSLQMKGKETPYHALMYTENDIDVDCDNEDDYTSYTVPLPSYFDGLDSSQFAVSVSIQKVWKNGSYIPYWFGCYGYAVSSRKIKLECMSAWKKYDDLGGETYNGNIVVSVTVIA